MGGVSEFPKTFPDFALPSFTPLPLSRQLNPREIPQLDVFIPSLNPSAVTDANCRLIFQVGQQSVEPEEMTRSLRTRVQRSQKWSRTKDRETGFLHRGGDRRTVDVLQGCAP